MLGKLGVYLLLVVLISPHIQWRHLQGGEYQHITSTVMILITSFGFAIIVPNLREYFQSDIALLRRVILIGSVIPLVCYFAWDLVIMGTLASKGEQGLQALMEAPKATSSLATILTNTVQNNVISSLFHFFTAICMLTAFLGVSLCLISFLSDGLRINQKGREGILLFLLTFAPPLAVVSYYPEAYIHALRYAGICCVVLLLLLPACMSIAGRKKNRPSYQVPGGAFTQWLVIISSLVLLIDAGYTLGA
jgi:tyrosine-specific transport protein